jgi:hypothetical protein
MNNIRKKAYWRVCAAIVILLTGLGFTPVMIPGGVYEPMILGLPYSLWVSFLITVVLVVLTYIGSRVHPGSDEGEEQI